MALLYPPALEHSTSVIKSPTGHLRPKGSKEAALLIQYVPLKESGWRHADITLHCSTGWGGLLGL